MKLFYRILLGLAIALNIFVSGAVTTLVTLVVLGLAAFNEFKNAKIKLCDSHVYKHLELGTLLYCDAEQATHKDYQYLGTAKVKCENVGSCSLA